MKLKRLKFLIILLIFISISCTSKPNKSCKSPESLIAESIKVINSRNTQEYVDLISYEKSLELWEKAKEIDKKYSETYDIISNKDNMLKGYAMSYNMLIGTIEEIHKLKNWSFDISDFEIVNIEKLPNFTIEKYKVNLLDNKKVKWSMTVYLSKEKDCYYVTEPIHHTELVKD
ncbi:hypothetical protein KO566_14130 [Flavobacteriaceae bacterium XHP0103]|uniref:hypothetical protein n=1 Tax=Marixanthotalea marina TaxID=2844359 RepID=UPI002989D22F|nr:hypothetical protein [Marixanthotalea marina]MBU3823193.1 hypothetical protein [Marixanthotalea marina]